MKSSPGADLIVHKQQREPAGNWSSEHRPSTGWLGKLVQRRQRGRRHIGDLAMVQGALWPAKFASGTARPRELPVCCGHRNSDGRGRVPFGCYGNTLPPGQLTGC
jgi:hypothetical protein